MGDLITIDDSNYRQFAIPERAGDERARGLVPRDLETYPIGCYASAKRFPPSLIIPRSEWKDRLEMQKRTRARLIDIRNTGNHGEPIPSRDQDGKGYCWAHSTISCILAARAAQGLPYVDLSAFAVACIIKNYRDQGGWGAASLDFVAERGVPSSEFWPQQSMSRANDNPRTWENAALHKAVEFYDLETRDLDQFVSALLLGWPVISDFNWWGHSVGTLCLESVGPSIKDLETWIWNSWGDSWSDNGVGKLKGSKAMPDDAIAVLVTTPSTK